MLQSGRRATVGPIFIASRAPDPVSQPRKGDQFHPRSSGRSLLAL